jgi:hypothetical protein
MAQCPNPDCHNGVVPCPKCGGTGRMDLGLLHGYTKCDNCNGSGKVKCGVCDGKGTI